MEKEFVSLYLDSDVAKKIKKAEDEKTKEEILMKYIEDSKISYRDEIASLDDDILQMKGAFVKVKQELKKVRDEILEEQEKIWEDFQEKIKTTEEFTVRMDQAIRPVNDSIALMRNRISDVSFVNIERFESILSSIKRMSQEEKEFLIAFIGSKSE